MSDSIYQVFVPAGVFQAVFDDDESPVEYRGDTLAIQYFKDWLLLNQVSGYQGIRINPENLTPEELYGFCQPTGSGNMIMPPFNDLIGFIADEQADKEEPTLDNAGTTMPGLEYLRSLKRQPTFDGATGAEKLKLVKELRGVRGELSATKSGAEKLKLVKRVREIRADIGFKPAVDEVAPVVVPDPDAETDPNIGREWNAVYGRQRVIGTYGKDTGFGKLYEVKTLEDGSIRRYSENSLEVTIARNEYELTDAYAAEKKEADEIRKLHTDNKEMADLKAAQVDAEIAEFTKNMTPLNAGKARSALLGQVRVSGNVTNRKDWMEDAVKAGRYIVDGQDGRNLTTADGVFYTEKTTTKTGMDYAAYLIGKSGASKADESEPLPATKLEAAKAIEFLTAFIGRSQMSAITSAMRGEEKQFFFDKVVELQKQIQSMPKTYETDGQGDKAIAYLHYFKGSGDWYITEKDSEDEQLQAFGLSDLGYGGESGYISIVELIKMNVEIDLYWTPKSVGAIKGKDDEPEPIPPKGATPQAQFEAELTALQAETDITAYDARLDEIVGRIEEAGLMEAMDEKLNETADVLTGLMAEAEKGA